MLDILSLLIHRIRCLRKPLLRPKYNIARGRLSRKQIALTFDGHPGGSAVFSPDAAEAILEELKIRKVTCSFFLTGQFIVNYPDMTRYIVACGHEVGNHTFSHPHLDAIDEETFQSELVGTVEALYKVTGGKMSPYWRAPYGEYHGALWQIAVNQGFRHVFWTSGIMAGKNFDSSDWVDDPGSDRFRSSGQIKRRMLSSRYKNGAIALFHLGARDHDPVYKIIPHLIDGWTLQGYRCVTISELVGPGRQ